jgi:KaiC/GvpD/RAD55 family RecA-like ATPase
VSIQSGIAPLDEHLGGMIPGRLHLLTGGPGTGKSTACYHFLQAGLRAGETVALLTLDRLSDLVTHTRCVGLDLRAAVRDRKLGLLRFRSDFARYLSSSGSPYRP